MSNIYDTARAVKRAAGSSSGAARAVTVEQRVSSANRYREQHNPLRGLTIARAVSLMEAAQRGEFADLEWLYKFIEETDATPLALVERRVSAICEMDWNIKIVDQDGKDFDEKLAAEQQDCLREMYDRIDNLYDAIEHLEMASFRMFAHCQPHTNSAGDVNHLECLDQWNFVRDGLYGPWYWNPDAKNCGYLALGDEALVSDEDFIIRTCPRHVDRIALVKFIRKNLGEKDWASFLEIYGIPGAFIIGPPNVPEDKRSTYADAAEAAAEGGSGYLPNGSDVKFADSVRGSNPFMEYIKYFDEQMVLAGTGGKLTMLSDPTGIGGGASETQENTFKSIARKDSRKISEGLNKQLDDKKLEQEFPGLPRLAYFELAFTSVPDVGEVIEHAKGLKEVGYQVEQEELEEKTGYKLTLISPQASGVSAAGSPSDAANPSERISPASAAIFPDAAKSLKNRESGAVDALASIVYDYGLNDTQQDVIDAIADVFEAAADMEPAERDQKLIEFQERLPELLDGNDDKLVTAFKEQMFAEFVNGALEGGQA